MAELSFVPEYLRPFIASQDPSLYTPMDHASWRFILRVSQDFFAKQAHQKYLDGLKETGISTERIPLIEEMDTKLKRFGWRAVAVSGFIPPAVFMEFQSLGILPIACEMRTIEHLAYTPAPDIVHEAAGHAPIIADQEYAQYLRNYGEVARKAIFSSQDMAVYNSVRKLSIVKEDPTSTPADIAKAEQEFEETSNSVTYASEATLLARMNWWTVEYGLVGSVDQPRIYGAGLLSSVGESYSCLKPHVKKIPLTIDCVNQTYDITKPQPQLFVTKDFAHLTTVLKEFAKTMAFKQGGKAGLEKAKEAATVCTTVLDSGIQISGVVADFKLDSKNDVTYMRCTGPTQLAYTDLEIENQGPTYHREGFSTAIGKLKGSEKSPADLTEAELRALPKLEFASGIVVSGEFTGCVREEGRTLIASYKNCTVTHGNETLFKPEWGTFDLACGSRVTSVFGGPADRKKYLAQTGGFEQIPMKPKSNLTAANRELNELYRDVRDLRESKAEGIPLEKELHRIEAKLEKEFPEDWLLRLEILELAPLARHAEREKRLRDALTRIAGMAQDKAEMIERGLKLLENNSQRRTSS